MTDPSRLAPAGHDLHPLMRARWSPRAFTGQPLTPGEMRSLLEAARWSASCFNEQPWIFLVGLKGEPQFDRLLACLTPNNQAWVGQAGALMVAVARQSFAANGEPNAMAAYDLGQAAAQISLQAVALGLAAHQMRGLDTARVRSEFSVPEGHEVYAAIAIGHVGAPALLPEKLAAREVAPRVRKAQEQFAFAGDWGSSLPW